MSEFIQLDGSIGEGGGQILRTALSLSLVTGRGFVIKKIRARRSKPGLMRQHLTAVCAATEIGNAQVEGDVVGAQEISFQPRGIRGGQYHFAVGTAGSCNLILQAVLPALLIADGPSELTLEGGTHNPLAPPFDFLKDAFLPVLGKMGAQVELTLECPGFYPAGGGKMGVRVAPVKSLRPLELLRRGRAIANRATVLIANLPPSIAERERKALRDKLTWPEDAFRIEEASLSKGPGNIITVEIESEHVTEVFSGFGEKGLPAEAVVDRLVAEVRDYLKTDVPVGKHLADQLLLPLAMAGEGSFRTLPLSRHTTTNMHVIRAFLDVDFQINKAEDKTVEIRLERKRT